MILGRETAAALLEAELISSQFKGLRSFLNCTKPRLLNKRWILHFCSQCALLVECEAIRQRQRLMVCFTSPY